ncbi:DUF2505 domain-containing protein [Nocardioides sp. W3-2-3]|uniref:DUF2505 domain-containing protein n=1 Tax=Nocardioides convexus TaxID=2712224 RepID=UPI002418879F|nr:DUF2505 domain-containing protein [Nocardioides convexus]NHA00166.1 DUF2505 domain-containing protein [Nocardioides convexus]
MRLAYEAGPGEVFAMLADPAFREKVAAEQGVVSIEVSITPSGAGFTLVSDQVQDTAGLPAIAKKIAGETTRAVVREQWPDAAGTATIEITAPGKPTRATGTVRLVPAGAGTTYVQETRRERQGPADRREARGAHGRQHRCRPVRGALRGHGLAEGRSLTWQHVSSTR